MPRQMRADRLLALLDRQLPHDGIELHQRLRRGTDERVLIVAGHR
jgi:DNA-binding response OmpR family regulator